MRLGYGEVKVSFRVRVRVGYFTWLEAGAGGAFPPIWRRKGKTFD